MNGQVKNQSRWKAIILDLDGTLLRSDGSISDYTLGMLQKCKKRGIVVIVATARFWFKAEKHLNIILPDYAILADGTQIYHAGEMIYGCAMDRVQSDGIISELMRKDENLERVKNQVSIRRSWYWEKCFRLVRKKCLLLAMMKMTMIY